MRMLKAEAGGAEAKQLENEVDQALMTANTAWHWGGGDHDADLSDDERELVKQLDGPSGDQPLSPWPRRSILSVRHPLLASSLAAPPQEWRV